MADHFQIPGKDHQRRSLLLNARFPGESSCCAASSVIPLFKKQPFTGRGLTHFHGDQHRAQLSHSSLTYYLPMKMGLSPCIARERKKIGRRIEASVTRFVASAYYLPSQPKQLALETSLPRHCPHIPRANSFNLIEYRLLRRASILNWLIATQALQYPSHCRQPRLTSLFLEVLPLYEWRNKCPSKFDFQSCLHTNQIQSMV